MFNTIHVRSNAMVHLMGVRCQHKQCDKFYNSSNLLMDKILHSQFQQKKILFKTFIFLKMFNFIAFSVISFYPHCTGNQTMGNITIALLLWHVWFTCNISAVVMFQVFIQDHSGSRHELYSGCDWDHKKKQKSKLEKETDWCDCKECEHG